MKKDFETEILLFLYNNGKLRRAGFEEIRKSKKADGICWVGGSPRTINNHLKKLYEEELIKKEWGKRGKFFLSDAGEAEAAHLHEIEEINELAKVSPIEKIRDLKEQLKTSVKHTISQRILYLKAAGAPEELILIGEKMLAEKQNIPNTKIFKFYYWRHNGKNPFLGFEKFLKEGIKKGNFGALKTLKNWQKLKEG